MVMPFFLREMMNATKHKLRQNLAEHLYIQSLLFNEGFIFPNFSNFPSLKVCMYKSIVNSQILVAVCKANFSQQFSQPHHKACILIFLSLQQNMIVRRC